MRDVLQDLNLELAEMKNARQPYWAIWRDLADFYLPRRYNWLRSPNERKESSMRNPNILDSTGALAARTLATGMMNGITSPSRPWFKLRVEDFDVDKDPEVALWLDEVTRRINIILARSNFYNAMSILYLDLTIFGTAALLIYEDADTMIRCYNPSLGEFYLGIGGTMEVDQFAREINLTARQVKQRFGEKNLSTLTRQLLSNPGTAHKEVPICHMVKPNTGEVPARFNYCEYYWEPSNTEVALTKRGFLTLPGIFPRWEVSGNDIYGQSIGMEALGDVIALQHMAKRKAQGLDLMISPPMLVDVRLERKPTAFLPRGITYVDNLRDGNAMARPAFATNMPYREVVDDITSKQMRVKQHFHNELFTMISNLDTVRSATEIDARREEKLVQLGSVYDRFENEALNPAMERVISIAADNNMLPLAPESLSGRELKIQYLSVLATAQQAVAAIPTERWLTLIGNTAALYPKAVNIPNWDLLLRDYGKNIGVPAAHMQSQEAVDELSDEQDQLSQTREAAAVGPVLVDAAKTLSETDVGGGASALQQLLGG